MVTPTNIEEIFSRAGVPAEPDVLSIDIDGGDYWIWEAIANYRPRVVVVEYNSTIDPGRRLVQPRERTSWDGTDFFGASLAALRALGESKGYRLVHTELTGLNAFFVREDLAGERFSQADRVPARGFPNYFLRVYIAQEGNRLEKVAAVRAISGVQLREMRTQDPVLAGCQEPVGEYLVSRHVVRRRTAGPQKPGAQYEISLTTLDGLDDVRDESRVVLTVRMQHHHDVGPALESLQVAGLLVAAVSQVMPMDDDIDTEIRVHSDRLVR